MRKPEYRVTPWKNWCNDPNGLIFDGKLYHAFYQHYPDAHAWGPMHWGHMVSQDLYRWEHYPIALFPDSDYCFSGCAVMDWQNTSNLAKEGRIPMLLFYTGHPATPAADGRSYQRQCMAYSYDGLHFHTYEHNPIIPNNGQADFRDPKVFRYEAGNCWIMLLAVGDHIAFYRSDNLLNWEHTSDFGPGENTISGVWECPDLFSLDFEGKSYWILIVSMGTSIEEGKSVTQYFIGNFNGRDFTSLAHTSKSRLIDEGMDNYASVSFHGIEDVLMMGWAMNWGYADRTPTEGWCGQMTSVRKMSLYRDKDGLVSLKALPVDLPNDIVSDHISFAPEDLRIDKSFALPLPEAAKVFDFTIPETKPVFELVLSNETGQKIVISQDKERNLLIDRSDSGEMAYMGEQYRDLYLRRSIAPRSVLSGRFTVMLDGPVIEVFADDGTRVSTILVYPTAPYDRISIRGIMLIDVKVLKPYIAPMATDFYINQDK